MVPGLLTSGNVSLPWSKKLLGPAVEGIETYKGILAHSANWSPDIDWKGKRVAVIGSGSSSIKMVPPLAEGKSLIATLVVGPTFV